MSDNFVKYSNSKNQNLNLTLCRIPKVRQSSLPVNFFTYFCHPLKPCTNTTVIFILTLLFCGFGDLNPFEYHFCLLLCQCKKARNCGL